MSWTIEILMKHHLESNNKLQHCESIMPIYSIPFSPMTNNVMLTSSVGGTTHGQFTISIEQDIYNWWRQIQLLLYLVSWCGIDRRS